MKKNPAGIPISKRRWKRKILEVTGEAGRNPRLLGGMEFQERCRQCHMLQRVPKEVRKVRVPLLALRSVEW